MSLKKTDKIIAIIGVLILIIAGIGIFLYVGTEETTSTEPSAEEKMYDVVWVKDTGTMSISDVFISKKGAYTEPFEVSSSKQGSVITEVVVSFKWQDDRTIGILKFLKRGKDTLTANINLVDGEAQTHTSKGVSDNTTQPLTFNVNSAPQEMTGYISEDEAWAAIDSQYPNMNKASFETKITIKVGERLIRPLKYFLDKGNKITMDITYTYYTPNIIDNTIENSPPIESGNPMEPPYSQTNYPGKQ